MMDEPPSPETLGKSIVEKSSSSTCLVEIGWNWARLVHMKIPLPETWVVARKSPSGENLTPVATLGRRIPSMHPPVGKSHVRNVLSRPTLTIQRPFGEKSMPVILLVWPYNTLTIFWVTTSITTMVRSSKAQEIKSEPLWYAMDVIGASSCNFPRNFRSWKS